MSHILQRVLPTIQAIPEHEVHEQLIDGSLSHSTFTYYMNQKRLCLRDLSRVLVQIADRTTVPTQFRLFRDLSKSIKEGELDAYGELMKLQTYKLFEIKRPSAQKCPIVNQYTSQLLYLPKELPMVQAVAKVLPYFWGYCEVGKKFAQLPAMMLTLHPFADYIQTYSSPIFAERTEQLMEIFNTLCTNVACPHTQETIVTTLSLSADYELAFLDFVLDPSLSLESEHSCSLVN